MSLVSDFDDIVLYRIYPALESAMPQAAQELKETIDEVAKNFSGPRSRPLLFGHGVYYTYNSATSATVVNITPMQGTDYGVPEVVFVEEGMSNYHMPGPREFMEPGRDKFVSSGRFEAIIQGALDAAGLG